MFEAKFQQGVIFKKNVDSIKDLVKSVNINASTSGLSMQAMDSVHAVLVSLQLNENGFKEYRCNRHLILGLSIENLSKILKCTESDDSITLQTDEEEPSFLKFFFENNQASKISEFSLNLMSLGSESLGIPETDYSQVIEMSSGEFSRICKELSSISDTDFNTFFCNIHVDNTINNNVLSVKNQLQQQNSRENIQMPKNNNFQIVEIETSKDSVKFGVSGDIGSGSITIKNNSSDKENDHVNLQIDSPVKLTFALRYLNMFNKSVILSPQVSFSMSEKNPLMIEYKIEQIGSLRFYLAPKISDEESD